MIRVIKEAVDQRFANLIKDHYYIRLKKDKSKYIGEPAHRLVDLEHARVFKTLQWARTWKSRWCWGNEYKSDNFEIITGLDILREENPDENIVTEEEDPTERITIYRGILADNKEEADRYIKSTKTLGAKDFGTGMYWTRSEEEAKNYGNYIYRTTIERQQAKKILDAQEIVLLSKEVHKSLSPVLVDQLDLGYNAQYTFYPKLWKDPEMVMQIQERYKDYIKRTGGIFIKEENND